MSLCNPDWPQMGLQPISMSKRFQIPDSKRSPISAYRPESPCPASALPHQNVGESSPGPCVDRNVFYQSDNLPHSLAAWVSYFSHGLLSNSIKVIIPCV